MNVVKIGDSKTTICFPSDQLIDVRLNDKEIVLVRHSYKQTAVGFDTDTFTYKSKKEALAKFQEFVARLLNV